MYYQLCCNTNYFVTKHMLNKANVFKFNINSNCILIFCFRMLRFAVTEPSIAPIPDRYLMVETLTFKMLQDFHQRLFFNLYIEGLMIGNFSPQVFYS